MSTYVRSRDVLDSGLRRKDENANLNSDTGWGPVDGVEPLLLNGRSLLFIAGGDGPLRHLAVFHNEGGFGGALGYDGGRTGGLYAGERCLRQRKAIGNKQQERVRSCSWFLCLLAGWRLREPR